MGVKEIVLRGLDGISQWEIVNKLSYGSEVRSRRISAFFAQLSCNAIAQISCNALVQRFYKSPARAKDRPIFGELCKYGVATAVAYRVYAFIASSSWQRGYLGRAVVVTLYQSYVSKIACTIIRRMVDTKLGDSLHEESRAMWERNGFDIEKWKECWLTPQDRRWIKKIAVAVITNVFQLITVHHIVFSYVMPKLLRTTSSPILVGGLLLPFYQAVPTFTRNWALSRLAKQ